MNYLYFCLAFFFCALISCGVFLFCMRVVFLTKNEKVDPVNIINTPKKITAAKRMKQQDALNYIMENG